MNRTEEEIMRRRMHGLYLSRSCSGLKELARELMGLHCWFHRNVAFSALLRGAAITGWKGALTKTWLYRGTLHAAAYDDLPELLAIHGEEELPAWFGLSDGELTGVMERVVALMEDGVYSRAEMRRIFAGEYDEQTVARLFSPWGGIFVCLARRGRVAFRSTVSRDFDLISAEPVLSPRQALPALLRRFFAAYGPATAADAAWFLGVDKELVRQAAAELEELSRLERAGEPHYYLERGEDMGDIPALTLLSGFDPYLVSYVDREQTLPGEYKSRVILKSGICLPTVAVDGRVAGVWNIKKGEPVVEFFTRQPKRIQTMTYDLVETLRWQTAGQI